MASFTSFTEEQLREVKQRELDCYEQFCARNLELNMARGKPSAEQLDLSMPMLDCVNSTSDIHAQDGTDCRNYGIATGLPEAKQMMSWLLDDDPSNIIICGNASLNIMYDMIARLWTFGTQGCPAWSTVPDVKWLCPVPGYDRHFTITETFGIQMINIPMNEDGPNMDMVEQLVASDSSIKGIWCVPKYSNPTGLTYSDEVVQRLAGMECAAADFRIFWDNAYCVHHLFDEEDSQDTVMSIHAACRKAGNENRFYAFASTSKITFPGAGVSAVAASDANIKEIQSWMQPQTISHDKLNQLRHVRFFPTEDALKKHMSAHASIMRPKFQLVDDTFEKELEGTGTATWTHPKGGYFVSFTGLPGTAKRTVELAKKAGVTLTGAGAPFPYGIDPDDAVIRIAPSLPTEDELAQALEVFCCCVRLAALETLIA